MKPGIGGFFRRARGLIRSIRFRLTLWSVAILALILLVFSIFVYTRQMYDLQLAARQHLDYKVQQYQVLFRVAGVFDPEGERILSADVTEREEALLAQNESMVLIGPTGQTVQKLGVVDDNTISAIISSWQEVSQNGRAVAFIVDRPNQTLSARRSSYIFLVTPLLADRRVLALLILGSPTDPEGQLPRLVITLLLGSLATLGLVLAGGYWLAGRAMSPVRTITRTARGISETGLNQRLRLGTQDELGELADTFDAMLDRLEAAFDRQRQFTADASHELRTPLTIVGLETDHALARRRTAEEYERTLRVIHSENEYMAHLVNDLLTLARMDAGQTHINLEPLDLSDITLDVVERLAPIAHRDGVEMTTGELPELPVQGDRQFLTQMLTNLVENAIKYTGEPGKHVRVEIGSQAANGSSYAWVSVADDGPGIPAEHLPHLFDRFYRIDAARSRRQDDTQEQDAEKSPEGSGLGLSIVQWIAKAHGGQVIVLSEVGKGSMFEVRIPSNKE